MNTTVWKYPLAIEVEQTIEVPDGANAMIVQLQENTPCIWFAVDPDAENIRRTIRMVGTGMAELDEQMSYLGTVQLDGYVWHYFEVRDVIR